MTFFALSIRFINGVSSDLKRESSSSISTSTKLPALIPPVALAIADTVAGLPGTCVSKPVLPTDGSSVAFVNSMFSAIALSIKIILFQFQ